MKEKKPFRNRIKIIIDILSEVVKNKNMEREQVVNFLKETYEKHKIQPIRGKAFPPDLYDKEMASLYVVGKYGLGLDIDYPDLFRKIFYKETLFDEAIDYLLNNEFDKARESLKKAVNVDEIDSNTIARMLRIMFTKVLLGFSDEDDFIKLLRKVTEAFPNEERTVKNYIRFYIAHKLAESIYKGEVRDRITKEVHKQAIAAKIGFPKVLPSDDYVYIIAREVYNIPDKILEKTLNIKNSSSKQ